MQEEDHEWSSLCQPPGKSSSLDDAPKKWRLKLLTQPNKGGAFIGWKVWVITGVIHYNDELMSINWECTCMTSTCIKHYFILIKCSSSPILISFWCLLHFTYSPSLYLFISPSSLSPSLSLQVLLCVEPFKHNGLKRLLEAGGATVTAPTQATTSLPSLTHAFIHLPSLTKDLTLETLVQYNVPCLRPDYIAEYIQTVSDFDLCVCVSWLN